MSEDLARGAIMTDDEVVRFYNGIMVAVGGPMVLAPNAAYARRWLGRAMDILGSCGMVAMVGYRGCAVINGRDV